MSTIDTSIQRPYFRKQEYPRVVNTGFNELTKTVSDTQVEELLNEYRRIADSLPPEIHAEIAQNSGAALGIDIDEENFDEINRLNNLLDELESQDFQEQTIDSREHPYFRNGTFIKGKKIKLPSGQIFSESELKLEKEFTYYFMQQGYKREIIDNTKDKSFFKFLYTIKTKRRDWNNAVPACTLDTLEKIPTAAPITYEIGKETILTDIKVLPPSYLDASSKSAIINKYKIDNPGITIPEPLLIIEQANINAINSTDNSEVETAINRIINPPQL